MGLRNWMMKYKKSEPRNVEVEDVLVFDVETDASVDVETAKLKWFGAYSFKDEKYYFLTGDEIKSIQELVDGHYAVCGYNSNDFDIPICENNGLNFDYKVRIDLMRILFRPDTRQSVREGIIKVDGKILKDIIKNHKLKTVAAALKLSVQKGDLDYNILRKDFWTKEERQEILRYLFYDVKITKEMFEYFYNEFYPMIGFMSDEDKRKYNWFRTSLGSYTYKVICNKTGIKEEYGKHSGRKKYEGGFVSKPEQESFKGKIYCLDFNSAYPHAFMMGNLYSHSCKCCADSQKWKGNKMFPVEGRYCAKQQGKIEKVIEKFYKLRLEYKKNKDPREYAVKIILNTMYGISGSSVFKNLYSLSTASDCTLIAREMIKYARFEFDRKGYKVIYTDTDSVYLLDPFNNEKQMLEVKDYIIHAIKSNLPFVHETFGMGVDEEIKGIWFFTDESGEFKKKNYIYLTTKDKLKIKGLPIIKSNCSRLSKKIFETLLPKIKERCDIKFSRQEIENLIMDSLKKDIGLVANYYHVKSLDQYKNGSSIQAQISKAYGAGSHWLVPNKRVGQVGKCKKYCSLDEAKELELFDLDIEKVMDTELSPFIEGWVHPLFLKRQRKAQDSYDKAQDKAQQKFFDSDLWDSEAVGCDISDQEFWENEVSFE